MNGRLVFVNVVIVVLVGVFCSYQVDGGITYIKRRKTYYGGSRGYSGGYYSGGHYYGGHYYSGGGGGSADPTWLIVFLCVVFGFALLFVASTVISSIYCPDNDNGVVVEETVQVIHHDSPPYQQYAQGPQQYAQGYQQYAQPAQRQVVMVQPKATAIQNNNVRKSVSNTTKNTLQQKTNEVSVEPSVSKANPTQPKAQSKAQPKAQQPAKLNFLDKGMGFLKN